MYKHNNVWKKISSIILIVCLLVGMLPENIRAEEKSDSFINIAGYADISTFDNYTKNGPMEHMIDGKMDTFANLYGGSVNDYKNLADKKYALPYAELAFEAEQNIQKISITTLKADDTDSIDKYQYQCMISAKGDTDSSYTLLGQGLLKRSGSYEDSTYTLELPLPVTAKNILIEFDLAAGAEDSWPLISEINVMAQQYNQPDNVDTNNFENIAGQCLITVPSEQQPKENMADRNVDTLWINNSGDWPCTVEFQLPAANTKNVKQVLVKFERGHSVWSTDVSLSYALNNVTSDKIYVSGSQKTAGFDDGYSFTFDTAQAMTHLYITLDKPMDGANIGSFWPAIAEVEILIDKESEEVIELENIANTCAQQITTDKSVNEQDNKKYFTDGDIGTSASLHTETLQSIKDKGEELPFINVDFSVNQRIREFFIAMKQNDAGYQYQYKLLGRVKNSPDFEEITNGVISSSSGYAEQKIVVADLFPDKAEVIYSEIRLEIDTADSNTLASIPELAELQIFANKAVIAVPDTNNIAWNKTNIHSNYDMDTVSKIVDGNTNNTWSGKQYPAYVDIDLDGLYSLSEVQIYTPQQGYSQYTVYASTDGKDFRKIAEKKSKDSCPDEGERYILNDTKASVLRVLLEYNSESEKAVLNEVRVLGGYEGAAAKAGFTGPSQYAGSPYDAAVIKEDTISEVQGIIRRNIGEAYVGWFEFSIGPVLEYDYFEIEDNIDGKIKITGNNGVSLAAGLNHYLKYYCNVSITQVGNQVTMPPASVPVIEKIHKESKVPVRYAYNYCTMSYSMPFWGEDEWRRELDWLALNGVNVVLDITAQEEVYRQFLEKLGYDHASIKDFIAGPAYYAWAYMANLSGYGGPVHDSWFADRTELARKNQFIMRKLGIQPVLQGYSGMVPNNITEYAKGQYAVEDSDIIKQGTWCSYQRPDMLVTTAEAYKKYAALFYECQKNVYGDITDYYATDPFHEGGNTGSLNVADVSEQVMRSMLEYDKDAVWVIQAWQGNPRASLLSGLNKAGGTDYREHAIVLDLYAEKTPWWNNTDSSYDRPANEFNQTPWVYCMLNNFGGRMGLHGHMDNIVSGVVKAANESNKLSGIGIAPEGSQNNPVLYDLLFETVWCEDASKPLEPINTDIWLKAYAKRRYGAESESAYQAMLILKDTVYKASLNMLGQGAPESYINARPAASISAASTWGNAVISYDKGKLEQALKLLLTDYAALKESDAYLYDIADILKQVLSNSAQKYHSEMVQAYNNKDTEAFSKASDTFLGLINETDKVLSTRKEFLFGTWTEQAKALAKNTDDFTKDLYEFNAKALVTTWGAYPQSESGGLKDYSNRQWAGLTSDFYKKRWEMWIENCKRELAGENVTNINWFEFEWAFARGNTAYETQPASYDLKDLAMEVFENYSSTSPAADDSNDISAAEMTADSPNYQDADGNRPSDVLDNNPDTLWHTRWGESDREGHYIVLKLKQPYKVDGLRYLPRSSGDNGIITKYEVYTSMTGIDSEYIKAAEGNFTPDHEWKKITFEPVIANYVKFVSVESLSSEAGNYYSSAAEIRLTKPAPLVESITLNETKKEMQKGETFQLKAAVKPAAANQTVVWYSSNPQAAAVDTKGSITALKEGKAVITALAADKSGISGICEILVKEVKTPEEDIKVSKILIKDKITMEPGEEMYLKPEVLPVDAANKNLVFLSDNSESVFVDKIGKVKAISPGTAVIKIQASDESGITADCNVMVKKEENGNSSSSEDTGSIEQDTIINSEELDWKQIIKQIEESDKGTEKDIVFDLKDAVTVPAAVLLAVKENSRNIIFKSKGISYKIKSSDIKRIEGPLELTAKKLYAKQEKEQVRIITNVLQKQAKKLNMSSIRQITQVEWNKAEKNTFPVTISVPVHKQFEGKKVFVSYYNEKTKELELTDYRLVSGNMVSFFVKKKGRYVVTLACPVKPEASLNQVMKKGTSANTKISNVLRKAGIKYKIDKPLFASVNKDGLITARKKGNVVLTVTINQAGKTEQLRKQITIKE